MQRQVPENPCAEVGVLVRLPLLCHRDLRAGPQSGKESVGWLEQTGALGELTGRAECLAPSLQVMRLMPGQESSPVPRHLAHCHPLALSTGPSWDLPVELPLLLLAGSEMPLAQVLPPRLHTGSRTPCLASLPHDLRPTPE